MREVVEIPADVVLYARNRRDLERWLHEQGFDPATARPLQEARLNTMSYRVSAERLPCYDVADVDY